MAVDRLRAEPAAFAGVADLAAAAGMGVPQLGELTRIHYHATPAALLHDARLAAAARLLVRGTAAGDAARAVGYDEPATFTARFRRRFRMAPDTFAALPGSDGFVLHLPARFPAATVLAHLGRDPQSPTERVRGRTAAVALQLDDAESDPAIGSRPAVLQIELTPGAAACRLAAGPPPGPAGALAMHETALRLLGLATDPEPFERRAAREPEVARLLGQRHGLGLLQTRSAFEALVWVIAGQQVTLALAFRMRRRLLERWGAPAGDGLAMHPVPEVVAAIEPEELRRLGWSRAKADYLTAAARAIAAGALDLEGLAARPATEAEATLRAVRGLGPWSVAYLMMRAYGFADCLPAGDAGLARSLRRFADLAERPTQAEIVRRMAPFAPHRSFATLHLWKRLEDDERRPVE
ncbi:MAG TPA: helix-turn-helix domain-containing protein [Thermoanaerobaculia bacterium]|nr:helix-turn-helix domain-containing protein [Thermoanaerobaculia bacterium]